LASRGCASDWQGWVRFWSIFYLWWNRCAFFFVVNGRGDGLRAFCTTGILVLVPMWRRISRCVLCLFSSPGQREERVLVLGRATGRGLYCRAKWLRLGLGGLFPTPSPFQPLGCGCEVIQARPPARVWSEAFCFWCRRSFFLRACA